MGFTHLAQASVFVGPFLEVAVLTTAVCSVCRDVVHVSHGLPWFMDLGSMVFLSLVLVLAFRLIVLIFILTVAASFRVF